MNFSALSNLSFEDKAYKAQYINGAQSPATARQCSGYSRVYLGFQELFTLPKKWYFRETKSISYSQYRCGVKSISASRTANQNLPFFSKDRLDNIVNPIINIPWYFAYITRAIPTPNTIMLMTSFFIKNRL